MQRILQLFYQDNAVVGYVSRIDGSPLQGTQQLTSQQPGRYAVMAWNTGANIQASLASFNSGQGANILQPTDPNVPYLTVIGYVKNLVDPQELISWLANFNFQMYPTIERMPVAPTVREISANVNALHLIDPMASPMSCYSQYGTTPYSAAPPQKLVAVAENSVNITDLPTGAGTTTPNRMNVPVYVINEQGNLVPSNNITYIAQAPALPQGGTVPNTTMGMTLEGTPHSFYYQQPFGVNQPTDGKQIQPYRTQYTGWRHKFLYPNSRCMATGKDHFLQQEQYFPHHHQQHLNYAMLYGSAVRTAYVPWLAPNFIPSYINGQRADQAVPKHNQDFLYWMENFKMLNTQTISSASGRVQPDTKVSSSKYEYVFVPFYNQQPSTTTDSQEIQVPGQSNTTESKTGTNQSYWARDQLNRRVASSQGMAIGEILDMYGSSDIKWPTESFCANIP